MKNKIKNKVFPKNIIFKSFLPPALTTINEITYVIPGWHKVPKETTLKEVYEHWVKDEPKKEEQPKYKIHEIVISERTGEKYDVIFNNGAWYCSCIGFSFRRHCKHCDMIKEKYSKETINKN
jgi:hypothetical protein